METGIKKLRIPLSSGRGFMEIKEESATKEDYWKGGTELAEFIYHNTPGDYANGVQERLAQLFRR